MSSTQPVGASDDDTGAYMRRLLAAGLHAEVATYLRTIAEVRALEAARTSQPKPASKPRLDPVELARRGRVRHHARALAHRAPNTRKDGRP